MQNRHITNKNNNKYIIKGYISLTKSGFYDENQNINEIILSNGEIIKQKLVNDIKYHVFYKNQMIDDMHYKNIDSNSFLYDKLEYKKEIDNCYFQNYYIEVQNVIYSIYVKIYSELMNEIDKFHNFFDSLINNENRNDAFVLELADWQKNIGQYLKIIKEMSSFINSDKSDIEIVKSYDKIYRKMLKQAKYFTNDYKKDENIGEYQFVNELMCNIEKINNNISCIDRIKNKKHRALVAELLKSKTNDNIERLAIIFDKYFKKINDIICNIDIIYKSFVPDMQNRINYGYLNFNCILDKIILSIGKTGVYTTTIILKYEVDFKNSYVLLQIGKKPFKPFTNNFDSIQKQLSGISDSVCSFFEYIDINDILLNGKNNVFFGLSKDKSKSDVLKSIYMNLITNNNYTKPSINEMKRIAKIYNNLAISLAYYRKYSLKYIESMINKKKPNMNPSENQFTIYADRKDSIEYTHMFGSNHEKGNPHVLFLKNGVTTVYANIVDLNDVNNNLHHVKYETIFNYCCILSSIIFSSQALLVYDILREKLSYLRSVNQNFKRVYMIKNLSKEMANIDIIYSSKSIYSKYKKNRLFTLMTTSIGMYYKRKNLNEMTETLWQEANIINNRRYSKMQIILSVVQMLIGLFSTCFCVKLFLDISENSSTIKIDVSNDVIKFDFWILGISIVLFIVFSAITIFISFILSNNGENNLIKRKYGEK